MLRSGRKPKLADPSEATNSVKIRKLLETTAAFARNATKYGVAQARWVAAGCPKVPRTEKLIRLEICQACEFRQGVNCGKCNCYLNDKTEMATEYCPVLKWDDLALRTAATETIQQKEPGVILPAPVADEQETNDD